MPTSWTATHAVMHCLPVAWAVTRLQVLTASVVCQPALIWPRPAVDGQQSDGAAGGDADRMRTLHIVNHLNPETDCVPSIHVCVLTMQWAARNPRVPLGNADINKTSKAWDAIAVAALGTELQVGFTPWRQSSRPLGASTYPETGLDLPSPATAYTCVLLFCRGCTEPSASDLLQGLFPTVLCAVYRAITPRRKLAASSIALNLCV